MPAFLGSVSIANISGSAIVEFGDTLNVSPKFVTKTFSGAGSGHTGAVVQTFVASSISNNITSNLLDQPVTGNN